MEDKIFEFMEKMYSDLTNRLDKIENKVNSINKRFDDFERKTDTRFEEMDSKLDKLAEVQQSHFEQNVRNHQEIMEVLNERIDITQKAVKKLREVK